MKTLKQLEKEFPPVFEERINLIKRTMLEREYVIDNKKSNDERIYFKVETSRRHGECSFGLWQIRHETDDDFNYGFERFKNRLLRK